ncbi:uncharacterized protein LOC131256728 [Magnolia sinica]|uniref:uncharacterized protein LOC131256728 n=1 Tax=Magnolia sinica TaxID=86752 RepID=UPI002657DA0E|nr:uncharacterized protein LOC131256728 [Magnolia sinica]XP_058113728.1 uncharacterized protein LOC131256728 [Magnolia sinica]
MASSTSHSNGANLNMFDSENVQLNTKWEDVMCPICLDFPHNGVLLQCSSYKKGCHPFMCDTGHMHSNCLDRFKSANGVPVAANVPSTSEAAPEESIRSVAIHASVRPACPLCRGEVMGWVVVDEARIHLNTKKRCCEEDQCTFVGNYSELQKHAELKHPHARPSEIDPARQLDWENFQQSSEIIDVLSTIHSEVPHGVVLGDYVIEYGEDDRGDEYEDFPGDDGNWWTSCILYQVFDNFRASRNRRRSRVSQSRSVRRHSSYDSSDFDDSSVTSVDISDYRMDDTDDEFGSRGVGSRGNSAHRSSRRRRSRFYDH